MRRPGRSRPATWECAAAAARTPSRAAARATPTRTARRATPARSSRAGPPRRCSTRCALARAPWPAAVVVRLVIHTRAPARWRCSCATGGRGIAGGERRHGHVRNVGGRPRGRVGAERRGAGSADLTRPPPQIGPNARRYLGRDEPANRAPIRDRCRHPRRDRGRAGMLAAAARSCRRLRPGLPAPRRIGRGFRPRECGCAPAVETLHRFKGRSLRQESRSDARSRLASAVFARPVT